MELLRHDSPCASPHSCVLKNLHSPPAACHTAFRQRKKGRQEEEHLPHCISEEGVCGVVECDELMVDLQQMAVGERAWSDPGQHQKQLTPFGLFMPSIFSSSSTTAATSSGLSSGPTRSASISWASLGEMRTNLFRTASDSAPFPSVSPRRNSASGLLSGGIPRGDLFSHGLSMAAVSDDYALTRMADAAGACAASRCPEDDQGRAMKRRSVECPRPAAVASSLTAAVVMINSQGAVASGSPVPSVRQRRRASISRFSFIASAPASADCLGELEQSLDSHLPRSIGPNSPASEEQAWATSADSSGIAASTMHRGDRCGTEGAFPATPFGSLQAPDEGFCISSVLADTELGLEGSSDKFARLGQRLRTSVAAELPPRPAAGTGCSSWSQESVAACPVAAWRLPFEDTEDEEELSGMEGLAVRTLHTEEDFQTPPQSPDGKSISAKAVQLLASRREARRRAVAGCGHVDADHEEDSRPAVPVEQLTSLDEFNAHLHRAASRGNRGRTDCLWAELCRKGVLPNMQTLNSMLRCMANSVAHPDEAEDLARDVCIASNLSPNPETLNLLAETRWRYELLCEASA